MTSGLESSKTHSSDIIPNMWIYKFQN